jgi:hypothetical protein
MRRLRALLAVTAVVVTTSSGGAPRSPASFAHACDVARRSYGAIATLIAPCNLRSWVTVPGGTFGW